MTKELELFKRWFGIEKFTPVHVKIWGDRGAVCAISGSNMMGAEILEDIIKSENLVQIQSFFSLENMLPELKFWFKVPSKHHAEWEQYVKEKK